jgi:hypothetical protein
MKIISKTDEKLMALEEEMAAREEAMLTEEADLMSAHEDERAASYKKRDQLFNKVDRLWQELDAIQSVEPVEPVVPAHEGLEWNIALPEGMEMQCLESADSKLTCDLNLSGQSFVGNGEVSSYEGATYLSGFACFEEDAAGECNGTGA